jgi:2-dehydro-3-deoxyphosphooctonate aldolase (KDO 8-P synthase)
MHLMPFIAGPCVIEDEGFILEVAQECKKQLEGLPIDFYFKSSFDKANRTSVHGFRGPGLHNGLKILEKVKNKTGLRVFTDFHTPDQAESVARIVDFIQVPAFLCRQTDMIMAATKACLRYQRKLNLKKGQFVSPWDMRHAIQKVCQTIESDIPPDWLFLTERGTCFGYNTLVVDMISFDAMKNFGVPVLHDVTHSVQKPSAGVNSSGGQREFLEVLARAAMAAGASGLFVECHPNPRNAKSDGATALPLSLLRPFVEQCLAIKKIVDQLPRLLSQETLSQFNL